MDNLHKVGDSVTIQPIPPVVAEVVKLHENGYVTVKWPSGTESFGPDNRFIPYIDPEVYKKVRNSINLIKVIIAVTVLWNLAFWTLEIFR